MSVTSKIPKFKSVKQREEKIIHDEKYKKQNDTSYMQLNITKVYFLKKRNRDLNKQDNFEENITELTNKISTLCNKIKDVESCIFLRKKFTNAQLEYKATGDIDIVPNNHNISKSLDGYKISNPQSEEIYVCESDKKKLKNCFTTIESTSKMFCPSEFSFENMLSEAKPELTQKKSENEKSKYIRLILEELATRTEEIMSKIYNIDNQIKQIGLSRNFEGSGNNCQYCKNMFDELCEQKLEISLIVRSLKDCLAKIPESCQYEKQMQMLITSFNNLCHENKEKLLKNNLCQFKNVIVDDTALHYLDSPHKNISESKSEGKANAFNRNTVHKDNSAVWKSEILHKDYNEQKTEKFIPDNIFLHNAGDALNTMKNSHNEKINTSNDILFYDKNIERKSMDEIYRRSNNNLIDNFSEIYYNNIPEKDTNNIQNNDIKNKPSFIINKKPPDTENFLSSSDPDEYYNYEENAYNLNNEPSYQSFKKRSKIVNQITNIKSNIDKRTFTREIEKDVYLKERKNDNSIENLNQYILPVLNITNSEEHSNSIVSSSENMYENKKEFNKYHQHKSSNVFPVLKHNINKENNDSNCYLAPNEQIINDNQTFSQKNQVPNLDFVPNKSKINIKQGITSKFHDNKMDKLHPLQVNAKNVQTEIVTKDKYTTMELKKTESKVAQVTSSLNNKCMQTNKSYQYYENENENSLPTNTETSEINVKSCLSRSSKSTFDINKLLLNFDELLKNEIKLNKGSKIEPELLGWRNKSIISSSYTSQTNITEKTFPTNISQIVNSNRSENNKEQLNSERNVDLKVCKDKNSRVVSNGKRKVISKIKIKRKEYKGIGTLFKRYKNILKQNIKYNDYILSNNVIKKKNKPNSDMVPKKLSVESKINSKLDTLCTSARSTKDDDIIHIFEQDKVPLDLNIVKNVRNVKNKYCLSACKKCVCNSVESKVISDKTNSSKPRNKYLLCVADNTHEDVNKLKSMGYDPVVVSSEIINMANNKGIGDGKNLSSEISQDILRSINSIQILNSGSELDDIFDLGLVDVSERSFFIEPVETELDKTMNEAIIKLLIEERKEMCSNIFPQSKLRRITSIIGRVFTRNK